MIHNRDISIILDIHGVLLDVITPTLAALDSDLTHDDIKTYDDLVSDLNVEDIWNDPDFWQNLKPYPWAHNFFTALTSITSRVVLATDPHDYNFTSQILKSVLPITHYFPSIYFSSDKKDLARANSILIDDNVDNCRNFAFVAGSTAIVFPQPYNCPAEILSKYDRIEHVLRQIRLFSLHGGLIEASLMKP